MNFTFDTSELKKLNAKLNTLSKKTQQEIRKKAVKKGGEVLLKEAISLAPVLKEEDKRRKAGTLKKGIKMKLKNTKNYTKATIYVKTAKKKKGKVRGIKKANSVINDPFYWRFLEFGTINMEARPFLRPAFDTKKDVATNKAIAVIKNEVQKWSHFSQN